MKIDYKKKYLKYKKKYLNAKQRGGMESGSELGAGAGDLELLKIVEQWQTPRKTLFEELILPIDDKIVEMMGEGVVASREAAVIAVLNEIYQTRYGNLKSIIDKYRMPWLPGFDSVVLYDLIMITKTWLVDLETKAGKTRTEEFVDALALKYVHEVMIRREGIPPEIKDKTYEYAFRMLHRIGKVELLFINILNIRVEDGFLKRLIGSGLEIYGEVFDIHYNENNIKEIQQEYFGDFLSKIKYNTQAMTMRAVVARELGMEEDEYDDIAENEYDDIEDEDWHIPLQHLVHHNDAHTYSPLYTKMKEIYQVTSDLGLSYTEFHSTEVISNSGQVSNPYGSLINEFWVELQKIGNWRQAIMQPKINCSLPENRWSLQCFIRLRLAPIDHRYLGEPGRNKGFKQEIHFINEFNSNDTYKQALLTQLGLPPTDLKKLKALKPARGNHSVNWAKEKQNKHGSPTPGTNVVNKTDIVIMGENGEVIKISLKSGEGRLTSSGYAETRALFVLVFDSLPASPQKRGLQLLIGEWFEKMDDKKQWVPKDRNFGILKQLAQGICNPVWVGGNPGDAPPRAYGDQFLPEEIRNIFPGGWSYNNGSDIDDYLKNWCIEKQSEFTELNNIWDVLRRKHPEFCLNVLAEAASGKLKFGEASIGCANVLVELMSSTDLTLKNCLEIDMAAGGPFRERMIQELNKQNRPVASKNSSFYIYTRLF